MAVFAENIRTMKKIIFASNNRNKAAEIKAILGNEFSIQTMEEAGICIDIPEPFLTLEENAREKSSTIFKITRQDCFSEDSGLEVEALNGAPGVHSARYAGLPSDSIANNQKLMLALTDKQNRKARFRTVISLILMGKEYQFEGVCNGRISENYAGDSGFGYDPVFIPEGHSRTFAEMTMLEKSGISHRKKAVDEMTRFLTQQTDQGSL
jgi:XTP/dITP diphosphohydrolase